MGVRFGGVWVLEGCTGRLVSMKECPDEGDGFQGVWVY